MQEQPKTLEEMVLQKLRYMPMFAGSGGITHPGILRGWAEHLVKAGLVPHEFLVELADEDGNIQVSQLPTPTIKFQPAFRGPRHGLNNAARWVGADEPEPKPMRIPDIRKLTQQENEAVLGQYKRDGWIPDNRPGPPLAQEIK